MYIFSMIILIFFAIIGLCAFVGGLLDAVYKGSSNALLILGDLSPDNAEARIRAAARICRQHRSIRLRCVCEKGDPARDICELMQKEYPFMELLPPDT